MVKVLVGIHVSLCGSGFGFSTCQQKSRCLLGELVSMVSPLWRPFIEEGFLKAWFALFVVMMLNLLIIFFLDVISHPWFGTFGLKILSALKALITPS